MQLKFSLQTIQKGSDSIEKYLLRFKYVRDRLAAAEVTMNDQDAKILILAGLPIEYVHTRQIIRAKIDIGMEEVRSLLLSAEFELELKHKSCSFSPMYTMVPNNASCLFGTSSNPVMHNGTFGSHSMPQDNAGYVNFIGGIQYHGDYSQANNDFIQQSGRGFQSPMTIANGYRASFNIDAMMNGGSCIPHTGAFMSNRKYMSTFSLREMENKKELFSIGKGGKDRFESETIKDTAVRDTMDAYMSQPHNGVGPSLQMHNFLSNMEALNNKKMNGDFAEDSIRKFNDLSHTEGHISYPNFLANEGCINRRDDFKPQFYKCKAAKQADSKVLGKPNHMTSNIQILQNVSEVSEMAGSTVYTATKNIEKNIHVGVRPKALSATICTQQEPPAIATKPNVKASHSHVGKPLPVTRTLPLSVPTYPHLQQSLVKGIEAFPIPNTSTPDKNMVNCKQASHPMKLW